MALAPALDLRSADPRDFSEAPPASLEAEQALLGALLYEPQVHKLIGVELLPEHFSEPFHGRLYAAITESLRENLVPEAIFLATEFGRDQAFQQLGGVRYLVDLIDQAPPPMRAPHFAAHVLDLHHKRRLITISGEISAAARDGAQSSADILAGAETELAKIRIASTATGAFVTARQSAIETLGVIEDESQSGRPRGATTGLRCFDERIGGLPPTWLVTIGGRPGMGKTALLRAGLYGAADRNRQRAFAMFSLEAPNREVSERALSAGTALHLGFDARTQGSGAVQYAVLSRSNVGLTEREPLRAAAAAQPDNLFLFDDPILGLAEIRRTVWALKAKGDLAAIGIDYLQLMQREQTKGRTDSALIGDITTGLKRLAMEANICILLVSQLNRGVDSRDDKRPELGDLRESGSIEQDSNVVMFPFREAYYLDRQEPKNTSGPEWGEWQARLTACRDLMEVITRKVRQGRPGIDKLQYLPEYDAISNWTKD
jgi:replicative DNA helicase